MYVLLLEASAELWETQREVRGAKWVLAGSCERLCCAAAQEKHPDVTFIKVNTEDPALKEIAKEHVKVLPTFKFFKVRPPKAPPSSRAALLLRAGQRGGHQCGVQEKVVIKY